MDQKDTKTNVSPMVELYCVAFSLELDQNCSPCEVTEAEIFTARCAKPEFWPFFGPQGVRIISTCQLCHFASS